MRVPDWVYDHAKEVADERDTTMKDALGYMCNEGGYDA